MDVIIRLCTNDEQTHDITVTIPIGNITLEELIEPFRVIFRKIIAVETKDMKVSCKKGCSICCNQLVPLSIPEVFYLSRCLDDLSPGHKKRVKKRFTRIKNMLQHNGLLLDMKDPVKARSLDEEYFNLGLACPFLESGSCSIYSSRPFICREYYILSPPDLCRKPYVSCIQKVDIGLNLAALLTAFSASLLHVSKTPVPLIIAPEWAEHFHEYRKKKYDAVGIFEQLFNALAEVKPKSGNIKEISVIYPQRL